MSDAGCASVASAVVGSAVVVGNDGDSDAVKSRMVPKLIQLTLLFVMIILVLLMYLLLMYVHIAQHTFLISHISLMYLHHDQHSPIYPL